MKKTKKVIVVIQFILTVVAFIIAYLYFKENEFFGGIPIFVFAIYIFMFMLSFVVYLKKFKTIKEEKKDE